MSVTYSDDGVDSLITDHYLSLTDRVNKVTNELKSSHFKNFTSLADIRVTSEHVSSHLKYNEEFVAKMLNAMHQTSQSLNLLNSTIIKKIEEEQLETWLERPIKSQGTLFIYNYLFCLINLRICIFYR